VSLSHFFWVCSGGYSILHSFSDGDWNFHASAGHQSHRVFLEEWSHATKQLLVGETIEEIRLMREIMGIASQARGQTGYTILSLFVFYLPVYSCGCLRGHTTNLDYCSRWYPASQNIMASVFHDEGCNDLLGLLFKGFASHLSLHPTFHFSFSLSIYSIQLFIGMMDQIIDRPATPHVQSLVGATSEPSARQEPHLRRTCR